MFKSVQLSVAFLIALIVIATVFNVSAKSYYVSTTGNDANPGTVNLPFRTVQRGINSAAAGDTILLRGDVHDQGAPTSSSQLIIKQMGTASAPIVMKSYPGETAVICYRYTVWSPYARILFAPAGGDGAPSGYWIMEDLEFDHCQVKINSTRDFIYRRNYSHHAGNAILGTGWRVVIERNVIAHTEGHGLYLTGTEFSIRNNIIYGSGSPSSPDGYGLQGAGYPVGQFTLAGTEYARWANNRISNNTFAYNKYAGIVNWQPDAMNNIFENNVFYENGALVSNSGSSQGIQWMSSGSGNIVRNNLFYATEPGSTLDFISSTPNVTSYTESGSIHGNPLFVNAPATIPSSPDFHLQKDSPAIDKGVSIPTVTTVDFAGAARPQGAGYDIGAYEYALGANARFLPTAASISMESTIKVRSTGTGLVIGGLNYAAKASVAIYSPIGSQVASFNNVQRIQVEWNPGNSIPGIYLVKVKSGATAQTARVFFGK